MLTQTLKERKEQKINAMKDELKNFTGESDLSFRVAPTWEHTCGHKSDEYALDNQEILIHKEEILKNGQFSPRARVIFVTLKSNNICPACQEANDFRTTNRPHSSIQHMTFSHGLCAFCSGVFNMDMAVRNFNGIISNPSWEICVSQEEVKLGDVGIAITGNVTIAANCDIYSYVDETTGLRKCDKEYFGSLIKDAEDISREPDSYMEAWLSNPRVQYVWIKNNCSYKEEAQQYFEGLGYDVRIV